MGNINQSISIDPDLCDGKPHIKGTEVTVKSIIDMFAIGYNFEQIMKTYPKLKKKDIVAALEFAAQVVDEDQVIWHGG